MLFYLQHLINFLGFLNHGLEIYFLLFIQIIVALVLLILFSMDYSSGNLFTKFTYIGGIYALIKANSFVKEFIGAISTNITQNVNSFIKYKN